jgi:uncharacterized protein YbaR (Trm112 family)
MIVSPEFVEQLRCPLAPRLAGLTLRDDRLVCQHCELKFKIKDGLPNMIPEEAELPPGCGSLKQLPCQRGKKTG